MFAGDNAPHYILSLFWLFCLFCMHTRKAVDVGELFFKTSVPVVRVETRKKNDRKGLVHKCKYKINLIFLVGNIIECIRTLLGAYVPLP